MRILHLFTVLAIIYIAAAAPTKLDTGTTSADSQPFIEEVIVESVLQVRTPNAARQGRTTFKTNQDGVRVEAKPN